MKIISVIFVLFYLLAGSIASAKEPIKKMPSERLEQALAAYKQNINIKPDRDIIPFAEELYDSGLKYYQKNDINLAHLANNYATALNISRQFELSIPLLEYAINTYKNANVIPEKSLETSLLELGRTYYKQGKWRSGKKKFIEAFELVEKTGDELRIAETKLKIGIASLSNNYNHLTKKDVRKAKRDFEAAHATFQEANDKKQIVAAFWAGKASLIYKKRETAAKYFELVIEKAENNEEQQYYAMTSHAFLVDAYSKLGEEEKATEHCRAIGKKQVWEDDVEPRPLYIVQPKYPRRAAISGKSGYATLDFIIDSNGFAKNITVADSKGGDYFGEASAKVMKKWRFAPKFENGQPVEAKTRYTLEFKLEK